MKKFISILVVAIGLGVSGVAVAKTVKCYPEKGGCMVCKPAGCSWCDTNGCTEPQKEAF